MMEDHEDDGGMELRIYDVCCEEGQAPEAPAPRAIPVRMKIYTSIAIIVFGASCSADKSGEHTLPVSQSVCLANVRASQNDELGGERDEQFIEELGRSIGSLDDDSLLKFCMSKKPQKIVVLRLFFQPSDFNKNNDLIVNGPKKQTFDYLDSLPVFSPRPIESATAIAWDEPGLRLDWKARREIEVKGR